MSSHCPGFRFGVSHCGIKSSGALDLGIIVSDVPASVAAVFTQNRMAAPPVVLSRERLRTSGGKVRALVVNSGNANACTGDAGARDAATMAAELAAAIAVSPEHVLVASTGVIGKPLPMDKLSPGIRETAANLDFDGFGAFSEAILTTDKQAKTAAAIVDAETGPVTLIGCTKGAGMIAPNMATTLTFVTTNASIAPDSLQRILDHAVAETFNAITVDGDTSTNDMIAVFANGVGHDRILSSHDEPKFADALYGLLQQLARALMRDGEGVNHVVEILVRGADTADNARQVARKIANSPLVKTAIAGRDPNWGRILCAAGNAGVEFDPNRVALWFDEVQIVAGGVVVPDDSSGAVDEKAQRVMKKSEYEIVLDLGQGEASSRYLACDLSHDYVAINADYRT